MDRQVILETEIGEEAVIGTVGELLSPTVVEGFENHARYSAANFIADVVDNLAFGDDYEGENEAKLTIRLGQ